MIIINLIIIKNALFFSPRYFDFTYILILFYYLITIITNLFYQFLLLCIIYLFKYKRENES